MKPSIASQILDATPYSCAFLIGLKLLDIGGAGSWPWWLVLSPMWAPLAVLLLAGGVGVALLIPIGLLIAFFKRKDPRV